MSYDRDQLIRLALTPEPAVGVPPDLAAQISRAVRSTPQRRPLLGRLALPLGMSPAAVRLALLLGLLLAMLIASLIVLSRPQTRLPLTMYHGGPNRTGVMPGPAPVGQPTIRWQIQRDGAIGYQTMPLVDGGRVFVADDSGWLAALDEAAGSVLWSSHLGGPVRSSPVLAGDNVVVGTDFGDVVALGTDDGEERWRMPTRGRVTAALAVVDATVYVGGEDGYLYAVSADSGDVLWSVALGAPITRGPAIEAGTIYVGARGGQFQALDVETRAIVWSVDLGDGDVGTPAAAGDMIFVGHGIESAEGAAPGLAALSASDGRELWSFGLTGAHQVHAGAVGERLLYAVAGDGNVYALDRVTGREIWSYQTGARIATLAGLVGGELFVANSAGLISALDATDGRLFWSVSVDGEPSMPAVINGSVYAGTSRGWVVAMGGSEGERPD